VEIKDMADILLKGGKMLNRSCPKCNAPLFKHEDRTFCAKCNWQEGDKQTADNGSVAPPTDRVKTEAGEPLETLSQLQVAILGKIQEYTEKLNSQQGEGALDLNTGVLSGLLELLNRTLEIRESLNKK